MFPTHSLQDSKELAQSTAKVVDYELKQIMIKVWQDLPEDAATEEEKFVVEKLRNDAGDDISNVIGLNVTKRLLNTFNKLIVKVRFSCRPENSNLLVFLKKYRITGFKRIPSETNTFAAQLKKIDDFDKICLEREIRCGKAMLKITPCYNFMKRPPHLKTKFVYDTVVESKVAKQRDEKKITEVKPKTEVKKASKDTSIVEAPQIKIELDDNAQTLTSDEGSVVEISKNIQVKSVESNPITKASKITPAKDSQYKSDKMTKKAVGAKPTQISVQDKGTGDTVTRNEAAKPTVSTKKIVQSQQNKSQSTGNSKVSKKMDVKYTTQSKVSKTKKKVGVTIDTQAKSKMRNKKILMPKVKSQKNIKSIIDKYDDFDEMDDEDILAFLADGVVDECNSGEE